MRIIGAHIDEAEVQCKSGGQVASEITGPGGMHRELVRSVHRWYNQYERRDTVLVQNGAHDDERLNGMIICRVLRFISIIHDDVSYPCIIVNCFIPDDEPDDVTGMWIVRPERVRGRRTTSIFHLDCMVRSCHLMPVYGNTTIPYSFKFSDSLSAFKSFYLNHYIDFHSHEVIPSH